MLKWLLLLLPMLAFSQYDPDVSYYELRIFRIEDSYEVPVEVVLNEGEILTFTAEHDTINPAYISPYGSYLYSALRIDNDPALWEGDELTIRSVISYPIGLYEVTLDAVVHWEAEDSLLYGYCTNALYLLVDTSTKIIEKDPATYGISLEQNYPNPFNPTTTIGFSVKEQSTVSLHIVDVTGQVVEVFSNEIRGPGTYEVVWDATGYASGVYIYYLRVDEHVLKKMLTLIR